MPDFWKKMTCWIFNQTESRSSSSSDRSVVIFIRSAEEEWEVSRGRGRDRGAFIPECAAALGGDEGIPPWSRSFGSGTCGDPVPAEPGQSWTPSSSEAPTKQKLRTSHCIWCKRSLATMFLCLLHIAGVSSYVGGHVSHRYPSSACCWHKTSSTWTVGGHTTESKSTG